MRRIFFAIRDIRFWTLAIILLACTPKRDEIRILLIDSNEDSALKGVLAEAAAASEWNVEAMDDGEPLTDDFIGRFSSVVTTYSAMSQLDHRSMNALQRYLESGGGGIVALKDTSLTVHGVSWSSLEPGQRREIAGGRVQVMNGAVEQDRLKNALLYTIGGNTIADYSQVKTPVLPEASRYTMHVLTQGMDEPMEMAILPDYDVLMVERKGAVKLYDDSTKQTTTIANFNVFSGIEDGLLGVALDPNYERNRWVYFYYAAAGEKSVNRLSRMELNDKTLDFATEKVLLEIPTQRVYCCHSAGYLAFDRNGLLYLSTGDNTNAEETEGYVPIDERPGRELADDQATAANSNDLRGKILRIKPEADGTYTIPDGNLFPKDGSQGRPEIYVMGCRNPYRFSIDPKTGFLYWGDVGPDTKVPSSEGTLSFDEINQARKPGFYGWPYFLGNNEAFPDYDFATKKEGTRFNPLEPINDSRNNTGIRQLPPAQPAMIWYGDGVSSRFPRVGKGGESAMAGPVYYSDLFPTAKYRLSDYYDGKLFIYDWVRRWFMAVTLDEHGNYVGMEPFLDHIKFVAPTDMQFAPDGSIYILEYGTNWFARNSDARLIRVEYSEGNRNPVANIAVDELYGAAPFKVNFSAEESVDFDEGDQLEYSWLVEDHTVQGRELEHTFRKPGVYEVTLTVTDNHGNEGRSSVVVKAGNDAPDVSIASRANKTFYWDNTAFDYKVTIRDREDPAIDPARVRVTLDFLPQGKDLAVVLANPRDAGNVQFTKGKGLLENLDCKACHSMNQESVGPAYLKVAERYAGKSGADDQLAQKVIQGGSGNWGDRPMSSHPDLSLEDARQIVNYILSLKEAGNSLPLEGNVTLKEHMGKGSEGSYLFLASYTDGGANGIEPLFNSAHVALRNPRVQIEDFDEGNVRLGTITTVFMTFATGIRNDGYVKFNSLDLTNVKQLRYRLQSNGIGGTIEVRLDGKDGPVVSTLDVPAGKVPDLKEGWREVSAPVRKQVSGIHDVYFVFKRADNRQGNLFNVDWIYFANR